MVSVVVHGVTLAIKNQIKNEINRQHLVNQFVKVVHVQTYPLCLSENRLVFNCGSTGNLNVAGFDKYKQMFYNPQCQEQSGAISQTLARYFLYMYLNVLEGLSTQVN